MELVFDLNKINNNINSVNNKEQTFKKYWVPWTQFYIYNNYRFISSKDLKQHVIAVIPVESIKFERIIFDIKLISSSQRFITFSLLLDNKFNGYVLRCGNNYDLVKHMMINSATGIVSTIQQK